MPTPIYETLVREWSLAGRAVPAQGRHGRSEPVESPGPWWHPDDARPSYFRPAPVPAAPLTHSSPHTYEAGLYGTHADAYGSPAESYGSAEQYRPADRYGTSAADPYGSPADAYAPATSYRSVEPYVGVSGYGDGGDDAGGDNTGPHEHLPAQTVCEPGASNPASDPASTPASTPASDPAPNPASDPAAAAEPAPSPAPAEKPQPPAWERVAIL